MFDILKTIHYALIGVLFYALLLTISFVFAEFDIEESEPKQSEIYIDLEESPKRLEEEKVPPKRHSQKPATSAIDNKDKDHSERPAEEPKVQQTSGKNETTRTVNQRALFKQNTEGKDAPTNAGNPRAEQDTVTLNHGKGDGLNLMGDVELDEGLKGRGVVAMHRPSYPGNNRYLVKVVVRVTVDSSGKVTDASVVSKGTTTTDKAFHNAAVEAAKKTRFNSAKAMIEGGLITYKFKPL